MRQTRDGFGIRPNHYIRATAVVIMCDEDAVYESLGNNENQDIGQTYLFSSLFRYCCVIIFEKIR